MPICDTPKVCVSLSNALKVIHWAVSVVVKVKSIMQLSTTTQTTLYVHIHRNLKRKSFSGTLSSLGKSLNLKEVCQNFLLPVLWSETWNAFFKKFSSVSLAFCIIDWCVILCFSCLHLFVYLSVLFLVHDVFKGGHILSIECIPNSDLSPTQVFIKLCSVKYTDPAYLLGWLRKFYEVSLVHHIV